MEGPSDRPRGRTVRVLASLPHWILWVLCILLVVPALLSVPGDPDAFEFALYLAVLAAVTHYPILLPVFAGLERRARRAGEARKERTFRRAIWVIFALAALPLAILAGIMQANAPPPPTEKQRIEQAFSTAIIYGDMAALRSLVEGEAGVEHPLFANGRPAALAALHEAWPLLAYLLERGADPDHADNFERTARALVEAAEPPPAGDARAADYARVRRMLGLPERGPLPAAPPSGAG